MRHQKPKRCVGVLLVEVVIVTSVMTLSFLGLGALLVNQQRSQELVREDLAVTHAMRSVVERMRGEADFGRLVSRYQGHRFSVPGIEARGVVTFFTDETEDRPELDLPRDLNGDGEVSSGDVSRDYALLPVQVEIRWGAAGRPQSRKLYTYLSEGG